MILGIILSFIAGNLVMLAIIAILDSGKQADREAEISYWRTLYFQAREHLPMDARLEIEDE